MQELQKIIEDAWENRTSLQPGTAPAKVGEAVAHVLEQLDQGALRVAEKINGDWVTHQWIKKAVLLSFRLDDSQLQPTFRQKINRGCFSRQDHWMAKVISQDQTAQAKRAGGFSGSHERG